MALLSHWKERKEFLGHSGRGRSVWWLILLLVVVLYFIHKLGNVEQSLTK